MRKGLTLFELIFAMVIVAITFTIVPKLLQSINKSTKITIKEDAIFNTMGLMGMIINLPWDESNTVSGPILHVEDGINCNGYYRDGGFVGGRTCNEYDGTKKATKIGLEGTFYNDIDDYNNETLHTLTECKKDLYDLHVKVNYLQDNTKTVSSKTTNTKHIEIKTVYNDSSKYKNIDESCIVFDYFSFNIGFANIQKRTWNH